MTDINQQEKQNAINKVCEAVSNATLCVGINNLYKHRIIQEQLNSLAAAKAYEQTNRDAFDALSYGVFAQYKL